MALRPATKRMLAAAGTGAIAAVVAAWLAPWQLTVLAAWVAMTAAYLVLVWRVIGPGDGDAARHWATAEDDSRTLRGLLVTSAALMSLVGAAFALHKSGQTASTAEEVALVVGAVLTVLLSWFSVNTDFTLRYAHLYYSAPEGGVDFAGTDAPGYRDFAYLAFTIGMTYQVADTGLLTPKFRKVVLKHALLAYLFGAVIVAAVINAVAGLV